MRLTIVVPDSRVGIDGDFRVVDVSQLASQGIRAVQFHNGEGHIEFSKVNGVIPPNTAITDITEFQSYIDAWNALTPPPPTPEELAALAEANRKATIYEQLVTIDVKSIRAIREGDQDRIAALEAEAAALRAQL